MIRSKDLKDYFEIKLEDLKPGQALLFDAYLYFSQNQHLMQWRQKGDVPSPELLDKYKSKGLKSLWIHKSEEAAFKEYLNPPAPAEPPKPPPPEPVLAPTPPPAPIQIQPPVPAPVRPVVTVVPDPEPDSSSVRHKPDADYVIGVLNSDKLTQEEKKAAASAAAQAMFHAAGSAGTVEEQKSADAQARRTVQDLLDQTAPAIQALAGDIWHLSGEEAGLDHGVNVATYAVILAMAFGRIDQDLIADIALAGLLHDIGISQIPPEAIPVQSRTIPAAQQKIYGEHVAESIRLLDLYAPKVPQRVKTIIAQHHEKFDGSGYPRGLRGFKVDDVSQLIAMADLIDAMANGSWDGKERTRKEAFDHIETMEKTRTFPEFFNPEVFAAVVKWLRNEKSGDSAKHAVEVVERQARGMAKG